MLLYLKSEKQAESLTKYMELFRECALEEEKYNYLVGHKIACQDG
jgi:hypothetical protein